MMIEPPIDKMIEKAGNKFLLTIAVAKKARKLVSELPKDDVFNEKPITIAIKAFDEGTFVIK